MKNYQQFSKFLIFEELLIFNIIFNYENNFQDNSKIIKELIKKLKEKKFSQNKINNILIFLNELIDDNLITSYETNNFLEKYVLIVNFDEFNIKKCNKVKLFRNIREKWIEKYIEKIGISNNKKYLLDFIKEKNYTDEEIEILLNIFKFKGNDDNEQLKKVIVSSGLIKLSSINSFKKIKILLILF